MVALKNGIIQNKNGHSFNRSTGTWEKPNAETPKPNAETPKPNAETPKPNAETPKPNAETPKPNAETPKPRVIQYNIDGKQVYISSNDWPHFNELRAQLASGTTLNDDLIRKIKPILAELHL